MFLASHIVSSTIPVSCARLTVRFASVLANMPPTPRLDEAPEQQSSSSQEHIVTPATSPLTTPSNNAFHPDYIPKAVKARLTLDELKQVLDTSKKLLNHLQSEYLEHQILKDSISELAKEQQHLLKILSRITVVSSTKRDNDEEN
ncbi:hypothetical protein VTP01DRAFT_4822 [Rhizomucor pusillus]|uniref:uncharacterized protein n=1 Tax=Rhizomucor pusillus TaxID=4840 RepID=UPI003742F05C